MVRAGTPTLARSTLTSRKISAIHCSAVKEAGAVVVEVVGAVVVVGVVVVVGAAVVVVLGAVVVGAAVVVDAAVVAVVVTAVVIEVVVVALVVRTGFALAAASARLTSLERSPTAVASIFDAALNRTDCIGVEEE